MYAATIAIMVKAKNENHEKVKKRRNEKCYWWDPSGLWLVTV
jgi:hypothetical protein